MRLPGEREREYTPKCTDTTFVPTEKRKCNWWSAPYQTPKFSRKTKISSQLSPWGDSSLHAKVEPAKSMWPRLPAISV